MVAKESNQAKSGIGRSRSLRLDSSPVWSRGSRQGLSRRQICLRQIFNRTRLITALGFIKLEFGTLVEPRSRGTRYSRWGHRLRLVGCVSRPSHNLSGNGRVATSRDTSMTNRDLGASRGRDERLRVRRVRQSHLSHKVTCELTWSCESRCRT